MAKKETEIEKVVPYHAEVIVEIIDTAIDSMQKLGLSYDDALNGILSQVAVQVEPKAMEHAVKLNKQLHQIYRSLQN
tara:strand:+ start:127 stop:357 length:231 start_codon:yes stop_codon:yes gene_type:complete